MISAPAGIAERWADVRRDARTLTHLLRPARRRATLADQLEQFYARQADDYDRFRDRMLVGCRELIRDLPAPAGGVWVDLGGGTARNLVHLGPRIDDLSRVYVVDLAPSLLAIARARCAALGWRHVEIIHADAAAVDLPDGSADVVTCAYSLTMMPEWLVVIERARALLKPGGLIGVVDYYVSSDHARPPRRQHGALTRTLWPLWFRRCGVFLTPDHLAYLTGRFTPVVIDEGFAGLPYLPGSRVPYYRFIGRVPNG